MLPPSPLTDPDVQDYRFRFFMEELRSRMLSLTPSVTRRSRKSRGVKRHPSFRSCQFSYPLSFRGQVCETQSSLLCCPSTVLSTWHPSFLDRVPVSPVPRCHRSY